MWHFEMKFVQMLFLRRVWSVYIDVYNVVVYYIIWKRRVARTDALFKINNLLKSKYV